MLDLFVQQASSNPPVKIAFFRGQLLVNGLIVSFEIGFAEREIYVPKYSPFNLLQHLSGYAKNYPFLDNC